MPVETKPASAAASTPTDWDAVERDYRAGVKALRQIAEAHGVSHTAIRKRADRDGWTRDLSAKIAAKAADLVARKAVSSEVAKASEKQAVEFNANVQAEVRLRHRKDALKLGETVARLARELDCAGDSVPLPMQAKTAKSLVDAFGSLVNIEREAYGITVEQRPDDGLAGLATAELLKLRARLANG